MNQLLFLTTLFFSTSFFAQKDLFLSDISPNDFHTTIGEIANSNQSEPNDSFTASVTNTSLRSHANDTKNADKNKNLKHDKEQLGEPEYSTVAPPCMGGPIYAPGQTVCINDPVFLYAYPSAGGMGTMQWYTSPFGGAPVGFSSGFQINSLTATTTYYVEEVLPGCPPTGMRTPVTATAVAPPTVNAGSDVAVCHGTTVTLTATGTGTFNWSNGIAQGTPFSPTTTLNYIVTASSGGSCTRKDTVLVTVNGPIVNAGSDLTVCQGQAATLTGAVTGTGTLSWDNGITDGVAFTPTTTTTYTATATDGVCSFSDAVTVTVTPTPTANAGNDVSVCQGNTVTLTATGTGTYSWNNGIAQGVAFTPTTTTTYTATVTSGACIATDDITVTVNPTPTVNAGSDLTICQGQAATLTGVVTGTGTISWDNSITDGATFTPTTTTTYTATVTNGTCSSSDAVIVTVAPTPTVDAGSDMAVCQGNAVTLTATGAGTYSWNNGIAQGVAFTPTTTTTYTVTANDGTCTATDNITVTVNAGPTVNAGNNITVCQGNAVTLTGAITGAGTISWNNGITDGIAFTPGATTTYTATVTNGTCSSSDAITVTVNPTPTVNAGNDVTICQGNTAALTATGNATISWNNGILQGIPFIPTVTTTYIATATNGSCSSSDAVTVTVVPMPTVNAGNDITVCQGQSVTLNAAGNGTFSWNNGITQGIPFIATTTTTYTVTMNNGACTVTDAITVAVNPTPTAATSLVGMTITATPVGQSYQWINCTTQAPISGATGVSFVAPTNGSYAVVVTNANSCADTSSCVVINTAGLDTHLTDAAISIHPNPTAGKVTISMPENIHGSARVINAQGKLVLEAVNIGNGSLIDLSDVQTGIYILHVVTENGTIAKRVIRN